MNHKEIINHVLKSPNPKVKLAITDIDGVLRGKYINKEKFQSALEGGFGFCSVVFGWDSSDALYNNSSPVAGWHNGYKDHIAEIDLSSYRQVPWDDEVSFFLADFSQSNHQACPRTLLKKIAHQAENMGFQALFSQEFEWFNFKETNQSIYNKPPSELQPLSNGMFGYSLLKLQQNHDYLNDLYNLLLQFNVPLEGLHTETGPGVLEAAIYYTEIIESADRASLFKAATKEIALKHGIMPTFMAKISPDLPGSSGHVHQSLSDGKKNLFFDANETHCMSPLMQSYLAGQMKVLPELLPMIAPTVNSYKRLVEGMWAPTIMNWGIDNRTTTFRVINNSEKAMRIEARAPGADANPYLAMAALLAAGLYGIKHNLSLDTKAIAGNGYQDDNGERLAPNLWQATQKMKTSEIACELLGEEFINHFSATREWEWQEYSKSVSDWEYKRYFEII
ncbi:glutamine synthetase family protein [Fangia hongkongensis]|uniref:glutamine synthetase family protein n=1 Tax=Fangia hongkongensis TaxID=270495 RepID=UPI0003748EAB|nr:glutamine synthetase family protein [Fangia hongkongensis]MBK2124130.1 glutamine synthetase [Fangia hongkongensis]